MKMTRQHFEMIADVVSAIENPDIRKTTALNFTVKLHECNINFDTCRFLKACQVNDNTSTHTRTRELLVERSESEKKESFVAP